MNPPLWSKTTLLLIVYLSFSWSGYAQGERFLMYDYSEVGLTFMLPDSWHHDGLNTTTKAAFIKQFGWNYDRPDANDIWSAVGSFSSIEVDSTLFPYDSAFEMHNMTIFVNRANSLYRRWLCLQRRTGVFESRPLVNGRFELIEKDDIRSSDLPQNLSDVKGIFYHYDSGQVNLLTYGHVYTFIQDEKCYEIRLESTTANPAKSIRLHERIASTLERSSP